MKYLFSFLLLFFSLFGQAQVERIEPPFWWEGMKNSTLQLMLYGENLAAYSLNIPAIDKIEVHRVENPNYLFVDLDLSDQQHGIVEINLLKKGKVQTIIEYEIKVREQRPNKSSFNAADVIYLLMPDRFANGLEDLGVSAIWSTPLCEDNDPRVSYHTYAQSDVYRIDPRYGTNEDYRLLADALHQRKMKLIMDYVTNHWGIEHWMVKDLPTSDWIHQFETYTNTNHRKEIHSDTYATEIDRKELMEGWFVPTMADLNQNNPYLLNYLIQNAIWWIEFAQIDGFRVLILI